MVGYFKSINLLVNQSIDRSIDQSVSQSVSQSINQSINQSISQSINQSINQSVNQSIIQSFNLFIITSQIKIMSNKNIHTHGTKHGVESMHNYAHIYNNKLPVSILY